MKRWKYLDVARGIGLLLVIISHSCGLSPYLINYYIPLFFVVSGYLYKPGRSYGENVAHKAKRLLVPYFGYSALLLVFYLAIGRTWQETGRSALGVLYSRYCLFDTTTHQDNVFLFTVANGAMWYLTAFFVTSLVYHLDKEPAFSDRLSGGAHCAHDAFGGTAGTASVESGSRVCGNDFYDCRYTASESRFL